MAFCDVPPEEHSLTLALEYKDRDRWANGSYVTDRTIPSHSGHPYEVSAACYAGEWRMTVSVTGMMQGNPFVFSDHSRTRTIPSSQCPSR